MGSKLTRAAVLLGVIAVGLLVWLAGSGTPLSSGRTAARPMPEGVPEHEAENTGDTLADPTTMRGSRPKERAAELPPYRLVEETADRSRAAVRVLVVDDRDVPRAGAAVCLTDYRRNRNRVRRRTGADGQVEIRDLAPGMPQVSVVLGGVHRITRVELVAGRVTEVTVAIPRTGAVVEGVVLHREKGPLVDASVTMHARAGSFSDYLHAKTTTGGHYRIDAVPPGIYRVDVQAPSLEVQPRYAGDLRVTTAEPVRCDLEVGILSLRAAVRNATTGLPIGGATVQLRRPARRECVTDDEGVGRFYDLPPGDVQLVLDHRGYGVRSLFPGEITASETLRVEIALEPSALLHLYVTDEDGQPVVGRVSIAVLKPKRSSTVGTVVNTDKDGHAVYRKIAPGPCRISLKSEGFGWNHRHVELRPGENTLHMALPRMPKATEQEEEQRGDPALSGRVLDAVTRRPVRDVRIRVGSIRGSEARTDAEGRYVLRDLPKGKYRLRLSCDGYGFKVMPNVEIYGDRVRTLDFELDPASTVRLRLTDSEGQPVTGRVFMSVRPLEKGRGTHVGTSITADGVGAASYRQIVPGRYTLHLKAHRRGEASVEVEIHPGENAFDITLKAEPER
jgi:hypothetical protein